MSFYPDYRIKLSDLIKRLEIFDKKLVDIRKQSIKSSLP